MVKIVMIISCILLIESSCHSQTKIFYVSTKGNDNNSGTLSKPFATIIGARNAIRKIIAKGLRTNIEVKIKGGSYYISEPVTFNEKDSGSNEFYITYEAYKNEKPVFYGGKPISGFKLAENGLWEASITDVAKGKWSFKELFVNGQRAIRARTPNTGYFYMKDVSQEVLGNTDMSNVTNAVQKILMFSKDYNLLKLNNNENINGATIVILNKWDVTRRQIKEIKNDEIVLAPGAPIKPWNPWQAFKTRYYIENLQSSLDSAGEWYLNKNGTLYYKPKITDDINSAEVIAPIINNFVIFKGDSLKNIYVKNIQLKGLSFKYSDYDLPDGNYEANQAAATLNATIVLNYSRNIILDSCEIANIGSYGVWMHNGCMNCEVTNSYFHDMGGGGIKIGSEKIPTNINNVSQENIITNNYIEKGGRIFQCAVGIWVGQSPNNVISHNDIGDFYYSGISVGWTWGYGPSLAHNNTIEYNKIHDIGEYVLDDLGGIYTLGESDGTKIENNVIRNVSCYSYGGYGIYADEGSSNLKIENNLVYNTVSGGFNQHYGENNIIVNNIFADGLKNQLQLVNAEKHLSLSFENNIVYFDKGTLFQGEWKNADVKINHNIYWSPIEKFNFDGMDFDEWKKMGRDDESIIENPQFININNFNFGFSSKNVINRINFNEFDYKNAGVLNNKWNLSNLNLDSTFSKNISATNSPNFYLNESFENSAIGARPRYAICSVENKGDSIFVTNRKAALGIKSLEIVDAPNLRKIFDPYFYYVPNYSNGNVYFSFDILIEKNSSLFCESRENQPGGATLIGPSFSISKNILHLSANNELELPIDQWIHISINFALRNTNNDNWSMTVSYQNNKIYHFNNLTYKDKNFKYLNWLGFSSMSNTRTKFYLDNIMLNLK